MINVIKKVYSTDSFIQQHGFKGALILNAGSSKTRFGSTCINADIQDKISIDCRCDVHYLPFKKSVFDIAIIMAVLQYCEHPSRVASELSRVLRPNGHLYVDAPFVQPYCPDTPDLFRFTKDGLTRIFKNNFIIEECDTSIPGGSALAFYAQSLAVNSGITNRYISKVLEILVSVVVLPFSLINFNKNHHTAGAFYLV
jgi:SAM-dependent methyltransferase